jgi:hypothetical protein
MFTFSLEEDFQTDTSPNATITYERTRSCADTNCLFQNSCNCRASRGAMTSHQSHSVTFHSRALNLARVMLDRAGLAGFCLSSSPPRLCLLLFDTLLQDINGGINDLRRVSALCDPPGRLPRLLVRQAARQAIPTAFHYVCWAPLSA